MPLPLRLFLSLSLVVALSGCSQLAYYHQAAAGQLEILSERRDLATVLADPATPPALAQRLQRIRQMRAFAVSALGLPDNGSYRSYADLERRAVVWNVVAAPELSLEPKQWCFPLVGCLSYKGWFQRAAAEREIAELAAAGWETYLGRVPAYSSLGWFDDPVLNTFVHWPEGRLAELIFHELAHQVVYVDDDTTFNESYATAVGRLGAQAWLAQHGSPAARRQYRQGLARRDAFASLASWAREQLAAVYALDLPAAEKRRRKALVIDGIQARYRAWRAAWDYRGYDRVMATGPSNAWLALRHAYRALVPGFVALHDQLGGDYDAFHRAVAALEEASREQRRQRLAQAAPGLQAKNR